MKPNGDGGVSAGSISPTPPVSLVVRVSQDRHGVRIRAHLEQAGHCWLIVNASPTHRASLWTGVLWGLEAMAVGNGWTYRAIGGPMTQRAAG